MIRQASKILRTTYAPQGQQGDFVCASAWNTTATYRNQIQTTSFNAFKRVEAQHVKAFQLWNPHAKHMELSYY